MGSKSFLEKMLGKAKYGMVAVLAAGIIAGAGSLAYAKEINNEGWPLPDETQYFRLSDPVVKEIPCEYKDQKLNVDVKIESYVSSMNSLKMYVKYSFEDKAYMYVIMEPENGAPKMTVLADTDGNGSLETKYDPEKDGEEFKKDGLIPEWILEKVIKETTN